MYLSNIKESKNSKWWNFFTWVSISLYSRFHTCSWHGPNKQEVVKWKWPDRNEYVEHYFPTSFQVRSHISLRNDQYCRLTISRFEPVDKGIWTCTLHYGDFDEAIGKISVSFSTNPYTSKSGMIFSVASLLASYSHAYVIVCKGVKITMENFKIQKVLDTESLF